MRFYNRNTELALLSELSQRAKQFAQFTSLIGRRRVGKTELVRQHLKDVERGLYFFVEKRPSQALLTEFSECLKQSIPHAPIFSDWKDFFVFLFAESTSPPVPLSKDWRGGNGPLVAVFDEFQNFLSVEPSVYSILQGVWDEWHKRGIYEAGNYQYFLEKLDTYLAEFMGFAFEEIIKELLQTLNLQGQAPISFHRIGRWWNRQQEIDLVALNQDTGDALFVECKWTSKEVDIGVLHELKRKSEDVPAKKERCFYLLTSKSGFSNRLRQVQDDNLFLWDVPYIATLVNGLL